MSTSAEARPEIRHQSSSVFSEFVRFLADTKKWWLVPIAVMAVLIALLVILSSAGATPFIYSMD